MFVDGYDRSGLIERAIATLSGKLVEESIIVALVDRALPAARARALWSRFSRFRSAFSWRSRDAAVGLNANIMSLGGIAIAIGAMIDAAIVMVENLHKHIERNDA